MKLKKPKFKTLIEEEQYISGNGKYGLTGDSIEHQSYKHKLELSEEFLQKHGHKTIHHGPNLWNFACSFYDFTLDFVLRNEDNIDFEALYMNEVIGAEVIRYCYENGKFDEAIVDDDRGFNGITGNPNCPYDIVLKELEDGRLSPDALMFHLLPEKQLNSLLADKELSFVYLPSIADYQDFSCSFFEDYLLNSCGSSPCENENLNDTTKEYWITCYKLSSMFN